MRGFIPFIELFQSQFSQDIQKHVMQSVLHTLCCSMIFWTVLLLYIFLPINGIFRSTNSRNIKMVANDGIGSVQSRGTFDLQRVKHAGFRNAYFASTEREFYDNPRRRNPAYDGPIIVLPNFLSCDECNDIIELGTELESKGVVADLYLNHRVNRDIAAGNSSAEALALILEQNLSEEELAADSPSGFRAALPPSVLLSGAPVPQNTPRGYPLSPPANSIGERILRLLGCEDRKLAFLDDLWVNPTKDRVMIRDQTTVHYRSGEGVPPHVDGNHATVLVYLNDLEAGDGGRTIFPEAGIASIPRKGTALMYCSRGQKLLHFAERVKGNKEKWVMQLLIDHNYRKDTISNY